MGGGGGFDPVSIIGNMVFGSVLGSVAQDAAGSRSQDTAAASAEAELQAAEARQKADRKKAEAALLAKARQAERANAAQDDAQNGTTNSLGGASGVSGASASLTAGQLKARLGQ